MKKRVLTEEDALSLIDGRGSIHSFVTPRPEVFVGADWDEDEVKEIIRNCGAEIGGKACRSMGHGLFSGGYFFEVDDDKLAALDIETPGGEG